MRDADKMGKNERDVHLARIEADKFGMRTGLLKHVFTRISQAFAWWCVAWGAVNIAKCKPESISALSTLVEAIKRGGDNFGWLGMVALLLLSLACVILLFLYSVERRQKKRALEKKGEYQRLYETLLSTKNVSSGINPDGSTPKRKE